MLFVAVHTAVRHGVRIGRDSAVTRVRRGMKVAARAGARAAVVMSETAEGGGKSELKGEDKEEDKEEEEQGQEGSGQCGTCAGLDSLSCSNCNAFGFLQVDEEAVWATCHICFGRGKLICPECQPEDALVPFDFPTEP